MSTMTRKIIANKDGILDAIEEHVAYQESVKERPNALKREKEHANGVLEGLRFVRSLVADWDIEQSIKDGVIGVGADLD